MGKLTNERSDMKFEIQSFKKVEKVMKVKVMVLFSGRRRTFEQEGFQVLL
jgi:translation initiation factor IF-3